MWRTRRQTTSGSAGRGPGVGRGSGRSRRCGWSLWRVRDARDHACGAGTVPTGELALADELWGSLSAGMLCLADRGFYSFERFQKARRTGAELLWRVKSDVGLPREQTLADGS